MKNISKKMASFSKKAFRFLMSPLGLLLLFSLIIRCWAWQLSSNLILDPRETESLRQGMTSILFQHFTPPLATILNSLIFHWEAFRFIILFWFLMTISLSVLAMIYWTMKDLRVHTGLNIFFTLFYSLVLMRAQGYFWFNYDAPVYYAAPFFVWAVLRYLRLPNLQRSILIGLSSSLLVLTSTVPAVASLCVILGLFIYQRKTTAIRVRSIAILIPLLFVLLICVKNYTQIGVWTYSSKGGINNLQLVWNLTKANRENIEELGRKYELPEWWQWCYKNGNEFHLYGFCFGDYRTPDYTPLLQELEREKEIELAEVVRKDADDQKIRKWIFLSGGAQEGSRRFSAYFGKYSQKVWLKFIFDEPLRFFYGVLINMNKFFIYEGPLCLMKVEFTGPQILNMASYLSIAVMAPLFWGIIGLTYLWAIGSFLRLIASGVRRLFTRAKTISWAQSDPETFFLKLMALGFLASNIISNIGTCCDNARLFWMASPYLLPLIAVVLDRMIFSKNFDKIFQK